MWLPDKLFIFQSNQFLLMLVVPDSFKLLGRKVGTMDEIGVSWKSWTINE